MIPKGTIFLTPKARCTPGQPWPGYVQQRRARGHRLPDPIISPQCVAKTDRAYAEVTAAIRNCPKKQFSHLDIPFPKNRVWSALRYLVARGELRLVKRIWYHPPFQKRLYPLRIFTRSNPLDGRSSR